MVNPEGFPVVVPETISLEVRTCASQASDIAYGPGSERRQVRKEAYCAGITLLLKTEGTLKVMAENLEYYYGDQPGELHG